MILQNIPYRKKGGESMPRVRPLRITPEEKVRSNLTILKNRTGIKNKELSKRTGIPERTLYYKKQHPERLNLGELWLIAKALNVDVTEIIE